ncbi:hypothetical protein LY78DRAFT_658983 [Colletotrichum sublineola]|nr:hypothetical protein LY78DRAFT_658983 [Colletotrichum sublineola]
MREIRSFPPTLHSHPPLPTFVYKCLSLCLPAYCLGMPVCLSPVIRPSFQPVPNNDWPHCI